MRFRKDFIVEKDTDGTTLTVTGPWTDAAAKVLSAGEVDGLRLNYALGFCEGNLAFLDSAWGLRRLELLDRSIADLSYLERLGATLEDISVEASANAEVDLGSLPNICSMACDWASVERTIGTLSSLIEVHTSGFTETDLRAFRDQADLRRLRIRQAPFLESVDGIGDLATLEVVDIYAAPKLVDLSALVGIAGSLHELELEACESLGSLDDIEPLSNLRFLGVSDCGAIETLGPLRALRNLEVLHAWGSTAIQDDDLTPLLELPRLHETRMKDRRSYKPRVAELPSIAT